MIWRNVKNVLPKKGQEVIIRCRGEYNLAIFNDSDASFIVNVGPDIKIQRTEIYWTEVRSGEVKFK